MELDTSISMSVHKGEHSKDLCDLWQRVQPTSSNDTFLKIWDTVSISIGSWYVLNDTVTSANVRWAWDTPFCLRFIGSILTNFSISTGKGHCNFPQMSWNLLIIDRVLVPGMYLICSISFFTSCLVLAILNFAKIHTASHLQLQACWQQVSHWTKTYLIAAILSALFANLFWWRFNHCL